MASFVDRLSTVSEMRHVCAESAICTVSLTVCIDNTRNTQTFRESLIESDGGSSSNFGATKQK